MLVRSTGGKQCSMSGSFTPENWLKKDPTNAAWVRLDLQSKLLQGPCATVRASLGASVASFTDDTLAVRALRLLHVRHDDPRFRGQMRTAGGAVTMTCSARTRGLCEERSPRSRCEMGEYLPQTQRGSESLTLLVPRLSESCTLGSVCNRYRLSHRAPRGKVDHVSSALTPLRHQVASRTTPRQRQRRSPSSRGRGAVLAVSARRASSGS